MRGTEGIAHSIGAGRAVARFPAFLPAVHSNGNHPAISIRVPLRIDCFDSVIGHDIRHTANGAGTRRLRDRDTICPTALG
ncbi:hypothetical protein [Burkholderia metallica]|uniref:hypothetical protein n=1 Tax=Burkholderia metallica TaxID=488729 RepID=UPI0012F4F062|nr:hypothetical protein [Burkholderia metallica]